MNKGIEILLERMKSNPEEFVPEYEGGTTKWNSIMASYRGFLNKEDLEVFDQAHKKMVFNHMQEKFTQVVMKELLDPKPLANPYLVQPNVTLSGGTTPAVWANTTSTGQVRLPSGSITLGNTTLEESQLQKLLKLQADEGKKKATLR